ncbi:MAG: penicillin acylase family protein [Calditrichia bacterium]
MKWFKFFASVSILAILFYFLNYPRGIQPPIGKFLNPFSGYLQNGEDDILPDELNVTGLVEAVQVRWDERRVPHVFAENDHDLYFTQGFLEARDRLWQMDFLSRAAGGRIAEVVGESMLEYDRYRRRIGMRLAAERMLEEVGKDSGSHAALMAYTNGVNAWINQLAAKDFPLEFKLLDYSPEAWTPIKSLLILKYLAWDLTGYSEELLLTRTREQLGDSLLQKLLLPSLTRSRPVAGSKTQWKFKPDVVPTAPDSIYRPEKPLAEQLPLRPDPHNGSNNWAVSGSRTVNGNAILSNDVHLGFTLPSIWYEIQLAAPDVNVYGVSLPGLPAVVIGFNSDVSWGLTNAQTDVLDWYEVEFEAGSAKRYLYDGKWLEADLLIEDIRMRGGRVVRDTIPVTRHGLVVYKKDEVVTNKGVPAGAALRWVAHDASNELLAFLKLNRAKTHQEALTALKTYQTPALNFAFATGEGDIAIHHLGKLPMRWKHQGRFVSDGRDPAYDWQGWIPREHLPKLVNPAEGYVASSNQLPTTQGYPYNLYGKYASFERSVRIAEMLEPGKKISAKAMRDLQLDVLNVRAREVLPTMMQLLPWEDLSLSEADQIDLLNDWDFRQDRTSEAATFFSFWWQYISHITWQNEFESEDEKLLYPPDEVLMQLILEEPESPFFDIDSSAIVETCSEVLLLAFQQTRQQLYNKYDPLEKGWEWGNVQGTDMLHMARIKGLGRVGLVTDGAPIVVNATKRVHGPTWRMVVEMSNPIKAWGIYPGGQSGNPGSKNYDATIDDWRDGVFYELNYLQKASELDDGTVLRP